jgi:hypothetical protein
LLNGGASCWTSAIRTATGLTEAVFEAVTRHVVPPSDEEGFRVTRYDAEAMSAAAFFVLVALLQLP